MNKEFILYEQALELKELGFDELCLGFYLNGHDKVISIGTDRVFTSNNLPVVKAPLYQQAFRWFREKYDLQYSIDWNKFYDKTPYQYEVRPTWRNEPLRPYGTSGMCKTYEQAELKCLKKLIEIVKLKK